MKGNVASAPHLPMFGRAVTIVSVAAILFATLSPEPGQQPLDSPLCLVCGVRGGVDAILNVLLFVPLGVGLALSGFRWNRTLMIGCGLSIIVETAQYFFVPGRDASLGDVLTNTLGGLVGFALARNAAGWLLPAPRVAGILTLGWCVVWLAIQAIAGFALAPSLPHSDYYGQIAAVLGNFAVFHGHVLETSIGDLPITDARLSDMDSVRSRLLSGATVAGTVVPSGFTGGVAPILRVADDGQREIVLLAQDDDKLLFGVRTGAATLRLRAPLFAIGKVFDDVPAGMNAEAPDTLILSGSYHEGDAHLTARGSSRRDDRHILVTSSRAWTLVLPFEWVIEDTPTELVVSWIWAAWLTLPAGYWGARLLRTFSPRPTVSLVLVCMLGGVSILIFGLVLLRNAFGLPAAGTHEWLAASLGVAAGGAVALRAGDGSSASKGMTMDPYSR
jgi:type IV secretory pathway VirB2 component (pilin)